MEIDLDVSEVMVAACQCQKILSRALPNTYLLQSSPEFTSSTSPRRPHRW